MDEIGTIVGSFSISLSDKLFRLRAVVCKVSECSINGSAECSESDRERDCLSEFIVDCFRVDGRSNRDVESFVTTGESVDIRCDP